MCFVFVYKCIFYYCVYICMYNVSSDYQVVIVVCDRIQLSMDILWIHWIHADMDNTKGSKNHMSFEKDM